MTTNRYILVLFMLLFATSCEKVLDQTPESTFSPAKFYQTSGDAIAATNAIYDPLLKTETFLQIHWVFQDQSTDDAEWGNGRNTANQAKNDLDRYTFTPATNYFYGNWTTLYSGIHRANAALARIPSIEMDATLKARLLGEAQFLRGYYYYTLVRLYGKVPLILTETTDLKNLTVPRNTVEEVYKQIITDFTAAEAALPVSYAGGEKGRATMGAAKGMLASVYLTTKAYDKAAAKAKEIIDMEGAGTYGLWANFADVFAIANKNGKESIFEIQAIGGGFGEGSTLDGFTRPPFDRGGYGDDPPTSNLYNSYTSADLRKSVTFRVYSSTTTPAAPSSIVFPVYVGKYRDPAATANGDGGNNYPVMRYAEILLIYAEALNELGGGNVDALNAVNRIRLRAGLNPLASGISQGELRDAILLERRLEFAFEGHRRYDLIRTGRLISAINAQNPSIIVQPHQVLFPIPQIERDVNPLLDQNPGY